MAVTKEAGERRRVGQANLTHGAARHSAGLKPTREYRSWIAMKK